MSDELNSRFLRFAEVRLHDHLVGRLTCLDDDNQSYEFTFEDRSVPPRSRLVLGQQFEERRPEPIRSSGLPSWFGHLLPKDETRRLVERWKNLNPDDHDDFDLLLAIGQDLPGAVTLTAPHRDKSLPQAPRPLGIDLKPAYALPGMQLKMSVRSEGRGLVLATRNAIGEFIAKLDDPAYGDLPRLEFATTNWARAAGVNTHFVELRKGSDISDLPANIPGIQKDILLATRFDRSPQGRIHYEDFAQVLGHSPSHKGIYDHDVKILVRVLRELAPQDLRELFLRLVFCVIAGNGDAHLKNWAILYGPAQAIRLTPAYDLISTICRIEGDQLALPIDGVKAFSELSLQNFKNLARCAAMTEKEIETLVRDSKEAILQAWSTPEVSDQFSQGEKARLSAHRAILNF